MSTTVDNPFVDNRTQPLRSTSVDISTKRVALCRLTLVNGWRGNEPANIQLSDWRDAENGMWINNRQVESLTLVEEQVFSANKLTYIASKGLHLVPEDTVAALTLLADESVWKECSIHHENCYLFAITHFSEDHVGRWHAVQRVCNKLVLGLVV